MKYTHIKVEKQMLFTAGNDWHLDIFLEAHAQITDISLKAFSEADPGNIYNIDWSLIRQNGQTTQIPIDVAKTGHSVATENVHLCYEIVYFF